MSGESERMQESIDEAVRFLDEKIALCAENGE